MRKNPRRILSPQRLPFRHPGAGTTNLTNEESYCNTAVRVADCLKHSGVNSGVSGALCGGVQSLRGGQRVLRGQVGITDRHWDDFMAQAPAPSEGQPRTG
jgi:hypothetical protein